MYVMCLSSIDISCAIVCLGMILILSMQVCMNNLIFQRLNDVNDVILSLVEHASIIKND